MILRDTAPDGPLAGRWQRLDGASPPTIDHPATLLHL